MKTLYNLMLTLVIIGAINWGILGIFKMDLIGSIFGGMTHMASRLIFIIVGVCGLGCLTLYSRINDDDDVVAHT